MIQLALYGSLLSQLNRRQVYTVRLPLCFDDSFPRLELDTILHVLRDMYLTYAYLLD
jgi:hypothetical protein